MRIQIIGSHPQTLANSLHELNIEFTGTVGIPLTFMR
jgi:hypothetical protein